MDKKTKKIYLIILFATFLFLTAILILSLLWFRSPKTKTSAVNTSTTKTEAKKTEPEVVIPKTETFEVPILMYHYIRNAENEDQLGKNLSVSPANFDAQVKYLKDNNYEPLKLADLADPERKMISKIIFEKKKPIVLTFDDGYKDAFTDALPVLKKYEFTGTFFIIKNYIGKDNYMTADDIAKMKKEGMEIGSHSLTHPDLAKMDSADANKQITDSKDDAQTFCYPAGKYTDETANLVKNAGYLAAVTTKFGIATEKSDLFKLRRVRIENVDVPTFADKISAAWDQTPENEKH